MKNAKKNIFAINEKISNVVTLCIDNRSIDFRQKVNLAKKWDKRVCTDTDDFSSDLTAKRSILTVSRN